MSSYAEYQFYFNVFQFVFTCAVGITAWWRTREKTNAAALAHVGKEMQGRLDQVARDRDEKCREHKAQTVALEKQYRDMYITMGALPSRQNIERIHERLDGLLKLVGNMEGEIKGMSNTLALLQEHHLEGGK